MFTRIVGVVGGALLLGYMFMDVWSEQQRSELQSSPEPQAAEAAVETVAPSPTPVVSNSTASVDQQEPDLPANEQTSAPVSTEVASDLADTQAAPSAQDTEQAKIVAADKVAADDTPDASESTAPTGSEQAKTDTASVQETPAEPEVSPASTTAVDATDTQQDTTTASNETVEASTANDEPEAAQVVAAPEAPKAAPTPVPAKPKPIGVSFMITQADPASVRVAPNSNAEVIGAIARGTIIRATPVANSSWYFVQDLDYTISGYLSSTQLSKLNN